MQTLLADFLNQAKAQRFIVDRSQSTDDAQCSIYG
jgi:hypothetical protein